jgi:hypothetical protein
MYTRLSILFILYFVVRSFCDQLPILKYRAHERERFDINRFDWKIRTVQNEYIFVSIRISNSTFLLLLSSVLRVSLSTCCTSSWLAIDHKHLFPINSSLCVCVCTCLRDHSPSRDFVVKSITTWSEQTFEAQKKKRRIKERESEREILLPPFISCPFARLFVTQTKTSKTTRTIYIGRCRWMHTHTHTF